MASGEGLVGLPSGEATKELTLQWRRLIRTATAVAVLTSPVAFIWFTEQVGLSWGWALFWTFVAVIAFRGLMDIILRRLIPWPSLFGSDEPRAREEDIVNRRRAWYWLRRYRLAVWIIAIITVIWLIKLLIPGGDDSWIGVVTGAWEGLKSVLSNPAILVYAIIFPLLFVMNFLILLGPMLAMGITQMQGFEPGDAEWGVKLDDVRGQAEAKEEVRRVVSIWQSGEAFEAAGGKRERGMLFLGAPGTGKTMLSKAIATGFNCPFVSMPGSGFAQTFIGLDVVIVRFLAWKAKRLARKWGGQCIVFIDEIDAVGRRRSALGGEGLGGFSRPVSFEDFAFHGRYGSLTPSGDLILENRAWREKLFETRAPERPPTALTRFSGIVNQAFPGGMMGGGGQLALNQLLVVMDGIDNPPFGKRVFTNRINTFLDATYIVPRRIGKRSLRLPPPRPRQEQIYFIGATNVPLEVLDPALTRPGRMGRYVWLRTPTKKDRLDIFDLYLAKVAHDAELDTDKRRDEIARITNGYAQPLDAKVLTPVGWKLNGRHRGRGRGDRRKREADDRRGCPSARRDGCVSRPAQRRHFYPLHGRPSLERGRARSPNAAADVHPGRVGGSTAALVCKRQSLLSAQALSGRVLCAGGAADRSLPGGLHARRWRPHEHHTRHLQRRRGVGGTCRRAAARGRGARTARSPQLVA